jgi:hypothetical protein
MYLTGYKAENDVRPSTEEARDTYVARADIDIAMCGSFHWL